MAESVTTAAEEIELLAAVNASAGMLVKSMGIEFISVSPEQVVGTMPVEGNTQVLGLLHGGAVAVLAESLGTTGAALHAGADRIAVSVDLNITHHRSVRDGTLFGTATALKLGTTICSYAIEVTDHDDNLVATARLTCAVREA